MKRFYLNIQLFADGAGAAEGGTGEAAGKSAVAEPGKGREGDLSKVIYGKPELSDDNSTETKKEEATGQQSKDKTATFESMIKGEFKEEFDGRVQKIVKERLGDTKRLEKQAEAYAQQDAALKPVLKMLSEKYGVKDGDYDALMQAIQEDSSFYEDEAAKKGVTVEQLKSIRKLENENERLRNAARAQEEQRRSQEIYGQWMSQAEELKNKYGLEDFDFAKEAANKDFTSVLKAGGTVEAAYMATHFDEVLGGAMAATAKNVNQKLASNIASRNARPTEGAVSSQPGVIVKSDVSKFTKADRREIMRRVERGETIHL